MEVTHSIHSVPIRLTSERWMHIVENHDDLAGRYHDVLEAVADPDLVMKGKGEDETKTVTAHAKNTMEQATVKETLKFIPSLLRMRFAHTWFDYDKDADTLYVSFERPQQATDSELLPNDILVRRRGNKMVGLTIMKASRFRS